MKKNVLFLLLVLFLHFVKAQNPLFNYVFYDNTTEVQAYATLETHERDFLFLTNSRIFKADTLGNVLWSKAMNGFLFSAITATQDSNFVLVGGNPKLIGMNNICCLKMDKNGDTLWAKQTDLGGEEYLYCVQELMEGGYIVAGNQTIGGSDERLLVAKLDTNGNVIWAKTFDAGNASWGSYERLYSIKQTADSGFIATGYINGAVLMKLSAAGNIEWAKRTQQNGWGFDVLVENDGYRWLLGEEMGMLAKVDTLGNMVTHTNYNHWINASDVTPYIPPAKLHAISDHRYLFSFRNGHIDWGMPPAVVTDSLGNILWASRPRMYLQDVIETQDKGVLMLGNGPVMGVRQTGTLYFTPHTGVYKVDSLGNGWGVCVDNTDVDTITHLVFLNNISLIPINITAYQQLPCPDFQNVTTLRGLGCVDATGSITDGQTPIFSIYPNPSTGTFQFQQNTVTPLQFDKVEIYNVIGKKVADFINPDVSQLEIDLSQQAEGVYFVVAYQQGKMGTQKVRIERE